MFWCVRGKSWLVGIEQDMYARTHLQPQDHEFKEGGNMHSPDKQGFLLKQGHGLRSGFRERCVKWSN